MFAAIEKSIAHLTRTVALIGGAGLLAAILVTCLSILGKLCRRLLNAVFGADFDLPLLSAVGPILGEEELVQYAVGFALFTALPWLVLQQGNITVDLLKSYFTAGMNRVLDLLGHIVFTAIIYLIMTQQWFLIFAKTRRGQDTLPQLLFGGDWGGLLSRLRVSDESQILGLKLWPLYTVAELCVILLFIVSLFCVVRSLRGLFFSDARHE